MFSWPASIVGLLICLLLPSFSRFDFIVHSGDIIDIPMEHMDAAPDVEAERCQQVHEVIAKLTACAKGAPVYYIPGNVCCSFAVPRQHLP